MTPITTVLDETEQQLAPLERRYCLAEWDAAVGGDDERRGARRRGVARARGRARRRGALRARSQPAETPARPDRRAPADRCCATRAGAYQRPRELAERIVRLEASLQTLYSQAPRRRSTAREVSNNDIDMILRDSSRPRRAPCRLGCVQGDRPRGRRPGARARTPAQRGRARPRLPRPLRHGARAAGARRGLALRAARPARRRRSRGSWARRRRRSTRRSARRLGIPAEQALRPWDYADAFFQDAAAGRRTTRSRPRWPRSTRWRRRAPTSRRSATRSRRSSPAATSTRATPSTRARSASRSIAPTTSASSRTSSRASAGSRRCCTSSATAVYDVAIERGLPWLLRTPRAHLRDRGDRDAARPASPATRPFLRTLLRALDELADAPVQPRRSSAAPLHVLTALGAGHDPLRARALRRPRRRSRHHLVGSRRAPPARPPPDGDRPRRLGEQAAHRAGAGLLPQLPARARSRPPSSSGRSSARPGSASPAGAPAVAGAFLRDRFMRLGASLRWDALIEHATGSPLVPEHYVRTLSR